MAKQNNLEQARSTFATLCRSMENNNWPYEKDEEELTIHCAAQWEDLPMEVTVKVDDERSLVLLFSHLPFVVSEDKRLEMAIAISAINNDIVDGSFDYDVTSGNIVFRLTNSFIESKISADVFTYMLACSFCTVDEFNDKLLMLSKGVLSLEQFISTLKK